MKSPSDKELCKRVDRMSEELAAILKRFNRENQGRTKFKTRDQLNLTEPKRVRDCAAPWLKPLG